MCVEIALAGLLALVPPQGGDEDPVRQVLAAQAERAATMRRVAAAVCSVMPIDSAGGGSGVIIDPTGFVLSNYHVVQRRKARKAPKPPAKKPAEKTPGDDAYELTADQIDALRAQLPAEAQALLPQLQPGRVSSAADRARLREIWFRFAPKFVPPPRYRPEPPDADTDDPAWRTMKIGLPDGELYLADVLGIDPGSDLAILKLRPKADGKPYPFAELGNSDELLVGETVFAMGNPFLLATDFQPTVTQGIVSGTHRYQPGGANRFLVYPDCIQVDAPVNPGNSGGPLFNLRGEVVGINGRISIRDRGRVNVGVGFAIASQQIKNFLADLLAGRHCEHGTLDLNAWFMAAPGDEDRRGVFVQSIFADSVVTKIGVRLGDELTKFDGQKVLGANQLATMIGVLPAGSWVELGFRRRGDDGFGAEQTALVKLTRLDTGSSRDPDRLATGDHRRLGARALWRTMPRLEDPAVKLVGFVVRGPNEERIAWSRSARAVRLESGDHVVLRDAAGRVRARSGGEPWRDATTEEAVWIDRVSRGLALLAAGPERRALLTESNLIGGAHVLGRPASRFELPGKPRQEIWLHADGSCAGAVWRDPVHKRRVEWRFDVSTGRARRRIDDEAPSDGWRIERFEPPADSFQEDR